MQAVDEWDDAADMIVEREKIIAKLEKFERLASDPNRFFEKGSTSNKSIASIDYTYIMQQFKQEYFYFRSQVFVALH